MRIPKSLNISYNFCYNKEALLKKVLEDRNKLDITFNEHLTKRKHRDLNPDSICLTVKEGRIKAGKCRLPKKICFVRFFGKENLTYYVIAIMHNDFIEVITAWTKKGN
ncbi:MAG: hypothetical protein V1906_01695 [Candidatus Woesearchaeota archaeon]